MSKPKDLFVSSDIPIDTSVSEGLKRKICANEYDDFGLLLNNKKDHDSFHLCYLCFHLWHGIIKWPTTHHIGTKANVKTYKFNWNVGHTAYQIFVGVYTRRYPVEAPFLIKYSEIIRDLAARGYNFRRERSKSQTKRPKAYSWGAVHWELWIRSQPSRINYSQIKRFEGESKSGFRAHKGYCWKCHKGLKCVGCSFKLISA